LNRSPFLPFALDLEVRSSASLPPPPHPPPRHRESPPRRCPPPAPCPRKSPEPTTLDWTLATPPPPPGCFAPHSSPPAPPSPPPHPSIHYQHAQRPPPHLSQHHIPSYRRSAPHPSRWSRQLAPGCFAMNSQTILQQLASRSARSADGFLRDQRPFWPASLQLAAPTPRRSPSAGAWA